MKISYSEFARWFFERGGELEGVECGGELSTSFGLLVSYLIAGSLAVAIGYLVDMVSTYYRFNFVIELVLFSMGGLSVLFIVSLAHFFLLRRRC